MILLQHYGWNTFHQKNINTVQDQAIGRVITIKGLKYHLITENGELEAELSGKLLYGADTEHLPKVGDWVRFLDYGQIGYITDVLPRMNVLSRKNPGNKTEKQIMGANIDYAIIVQGLDRDFNIMRLERYITQIVSCEITPIVVLNKADLVEDLNSYRDEVMKLKRECMVFFCSTYTGYGIGELKDSFEKQKTYMLIGSSGVGKSSLMNILMSENIQPIGTTSESNHKGKHTTTTRDLFLLPNGSLFIDTPGMREFGLTADEGSSSSALFPAIDQHAQRCRFSDCKHVNEVGCAVVQALEKGELEHHVYESYVKLVKEQKRFEIKAQDKKRLGKQFAKMTKEAKDHRKKYKY